MNVQFAKGFSVITIDGPAASGKSSVSRELARHLGWNWVSTGAFYRGLAYVAKESHVDLSSEEALVQLANNPIWEVRMSPENTLVFFRGQDVTQEIFKEEVGSIASVISQYSKVRQALLHAQRDCAARAPGLVAEGRDCGTVVFPQAKVKIYLTANSEDRAARRAQEEGQSVEAAMALQKERDARDTGRTTAPLQIPTDAQVVDTTGLSLEEVIEKVTSIVALDIPR